MWQWATLTSIKKNLMLIYISAITLHLSWVCWLNLILQLCPISTLLTFPISSFTAVLVPVTGIALCFSSSEGEPRRAAHPSLPISFLTEHSLCCSGSKIISLTFMSLTFLHISRVYLWLVQVTAEFREVCVVFPISSPLPSHGPSVGTSINGRGQG